jgi:hypothetical protein
MYTKKLWRRMNAPSIHVEWLGRLTISRDPARKPAVQPSEHECSRKDDDDVYEEKPENLLLGAFLPRNTYAGVGLARLSVRAGLD